jgi:hypothetical protein
MCCTQVGRDGVGHTNHPSGVSDAPPSSIFQIKLTKSRDLRMTGR